MDQWSAARKELHGAFSQKIFDLSQAKVFVLCGAEQRRWFDQTYGNGRHQSMRVLIEDVLIQVKILYSSDTITRIILEADHPESLYYKSDIHKGKKNDAIWNLAGAMVRMKLDPTCFDQFVSGGREKSGRMNAMDCILMGLGQECTGSPLLTFKDLAPQILRWLQSKGFHGEDAVVGIKNQYKGKSLIGAIHRLMASGEEAMGYPSLQRGRETVKARRMQRHETSSVDYPVVRRATQTIQRRETSSLAHLYRQAVHGEPTKIANRCVTCKNPISDRIDRAPRFETETGLYLVPSNYCPVCSAGFEKKKPRCYYLIIHLPFKSYSVFRDKHRPDKSRIAN